MGTFINLLTDKTKKRDKSPHLSKTLIFKYNKKKQKHFFKRKNHTTKKTPIGTQTFSEIRGSGYVYIDKTDI